MQQIIHLKLGFCKKNLNPGSKTLQVTWKHLFS